MLTFLVVQCSVAVLHGFECVYEVSNGQAPPYVLNLTQVSEWTLELQLASDSHF